MSASAAAQRRLASGVDWQLAGAVLLALVSLVEASLYASSGDPASAMLLNLAATLPLALWRPRRLWVPAVMVFALFLLLSGVETLTVSAVAASLWVLYLVATHHPRWVWAPFFLPFLANALFPIGHDRGPLPDLVLLLLAAGALVLGDAGRQRSQVVAERDASQAAMAASLRERAAMEERARIAREMHDVVAHNLSVITVQAETARLTTDGLPEEGRARIEAIGNTARDALAEMRQLLGVLRMDAGGDVERAPQPGLDDVGGLVDQARQAETSVRLTISGGARPLPPSVDLAAYRIVQEALTNARRHAPAAHVDVRLHYGRDTLHVHVRDDGPGPPSSETVGGGQGLLGMRERAAAVGGTVRTGQADGRGFAVAADLPIPEPLP